MNSRSRSPGFIPDRRRAGGRLSALLAAALSLAAAAPAPARAADDAEPAVGAIRFYQQHVSSLRHARCRFTPSCSEYAAQAIERYGLAEGSARAADRLMRCNASAEGAYPKGVNGTLEDPVDPAAATSDARVPGWLLPPPEPDLPPLDEAMGEGRRERIAETAAFALQLEQRGDGERASTEFLRAGSLAGGAAPQAWAYARAGQCDLAARRWPQAERAFLTSGMLAPASPARSRAAFRAAASRFDAGAFAACERLLSVPALADSAGPGPGIVEADRVTSLRGLCAMGRGDWARASRELADAAALSGDAGRAARVRLLAAYADEGPKLSRRSPQLAQAYSAIVPGLGQAYAGSPRDGLRHLVFNAALIATVVSFARHDEWPAAYVAAGFALPFYVGNILGAGETARRHDRRERVTLLERALHESTR